MQTEGFAGPGNQIASSNTLVGQNSMPLAITNSIDDFQNQQMAVAQELNPGFNYLSKSPTVASFLSGRDRNYSLIHHALLQYANAHYNYNNENLEEFVAENAHNAIQRAFMVGDSESFIPLLSSITKDILGDRIDLRAGPSFYKPEADTPTGFRTKAGLLKGTVDSIRAKNNKRRKFLMDLQENPDFDETTNFYPVNLDVSTDGTRYTSYASYAARTRGKEDIYELKKF
jgi:hypothetical protein